MLTGDELLTRLRAAAAAGDGPDQALARVGEPPWIDSRRPIDLTALRMADIAADPRAPQDFASPHHAAQVLYWGLPGEPGAPIAGLLWDAAGRPQLFRGQVLAP